MRAGGEIVYVALGANLGDREATFAAVIRAIEAEPDLVLLAASPVFETEPMGPSHQDAYLNAVVRLRSWIGPVALLRRLQSIEKTLGRDRDRETARWGPRAIDLDILFFGDRQIELPGLVIPHPAAHERLFVMLPMAALAPGLIHPDLEIPIAQIADSLSDPGAARPRPDPPGWPSD